jgi:hypothetical protein
LLRVRTVVGVEELELARGRSGSGGGGGRVFVHRALRTRVSHARRYIANK